MSTTRLRRRRDRLYGVAPSGNDYYAFWADGRAGLYVDGTFVSYRSTSGPDIPEAPCLIHEDSEAIVGPGSIVTRVDADALRVWDVEGAATYGYTCEAGYVVSPAIYADGFLWWVEREVAQHGGTGTHATFFRLRKSRTDLDTDIATVYTYEAEHYLGFSATWFPLTGLAMTDLGVLVQCHWNDEAAGEVQDEFQIRFERDGGGATDNGWPVIAPPPAVDVDAWLIPVAPATAAGLAASADSAGFLAGLEDDAEASPAAFWSGGEWSIGSAVHSSLSADGATGALYGGGALARGPAATGTPTSLFAVGPAPAPDEDTPSYFFIKG